MRATRVALFLSTLWLAASCGDNHDVPADAAGPPPACSDGVDNDNDGLIDYPQDPGCRSATDTSEDSIPAPQCSDGIDNDGDGKIDYPDDPGCTVPQQDSELDTCPGAGCPQCSDGIDNDGNGHTDYPDDQGCTSAGDNDEFLHDPLACGAATTVKQLPSNGIDNAQLMTTSTAMLANACGLTGTTAVPAVVYELNLTEPHVVVATTNGTAINTVLDIRRRDCLSADASLVCNDDIDTNNKASKITTSLEAGHYYLVVSGRTTAATGFYTLHVNFYNGEGVDCADDTMCGPGLVCRIALGDTTKTCQKHVCEDGVDDDGDGKNDYPDDPGCASPVDDDETDDCPSGPNCPQCANQIDDDGDGNTDYPADTSCHAAGDTSESCSTTESITPITSASVTGSTVGATDDYHPSCASSSNTAPDLLYRIDVPAMATLNLDVSPVGFWDEVAVLLPQSCTGPELACEEFGGPELQNLAAGSYFFVIDGWGDASDSGDFTINVSGTVAPFGSCEGQLFQAGVFTCAPGLMCAGPAGARTCRAQCSDGMDNNGDGKTDYPNDPGCGSPYDDSETTVCPGAMCPACADGVDNDGDGATDWPMDMQCQAAGGTSESCVSTEAVMPLTTTVTNGNTTGASNDYAPSCGSSFSNTAGDLTYSLQVPALTDLSIELTPTGFADLVHELLPPSCASTNLACEESSFGPSTLVLGSLAAGTYYYVVDGWSGDEGAYEIEVHGTIAVGGSCESPLAQAGALVCAVGSGCGGTPGSRTCIPSQCADGIDNNGDGKIDYPNDPGCSSPSDLTESTVCPGASCPVCADGADNDTDTLIDYPNDYGCVAAGGASEAFCPMDPDFGSVITMPTTTGSNASTAHNLTYSCQGTTDHDQSFALQLPVPVATLQIDTLTSVTTDTVLAVRDANCAAEIACNDDYMGGTNNRSLIILNNVRAGNYEVGVAGYNTTNNQAFVINVHGTVATGTACTSPLFASGVLACPTGTTCTGGTCH